MANKPLAEVVQAAMAAYFEHLAARIERLVRSLSDERADDTTSRTVYRPRSGR